MQNRPFRDEDEMNNTIIHNINSMVTNGDRLFILGDISHRISAAETDALVGHIKDEYGMTLVLMHYPMISWYKERKGIIKGLQLLFQ